MKLALLDGKPEIFHTIQGEGKSLGKPSIFLRTSLCNLHCIWCDTDYTWNWKNTPFETHSNEKFSKEEYIIELSISEVAQQIQSFDCKRVVLTGGEPMMHQKELIELMSFLKQQNAEYIFEIETNATLLPLPEFDELIDQYNVSPKLSNSNNSVKIRLKEKPLKFYSDSPKANFKFVVSKDSDIQEILTLAEDYKIISQKIFLMPEGRTKEELNERQYSLIELCKRYNFNYTDRLHIQVYGTKRGV